MKKLIALFALSLSIAVAQSVDTSPRAPAAFTVSGLPAASSWTNKIALVTDGSAAGDCTTGSGSTRVLCVSNGTTWGAVAGAGGATNTTPSICPGGCGGWYNGNITSVANTLYLWLINIDEPTTMAKFIFQPGSSVNHAWAIYSVAGNKLATSSVSAGCGGCIYSLAFSYTFTAPGSYYLAESSDGIALFTTSGSNWAPPGVGSVTTPMMGTAANSVSWSAGVPTFPATTGAITGASVGFPYARITY